jgi:hypothetical protein
MHEPPERISARSAALFVAVALRLPVALRLANRSDVDLAPEEGTLFRNALKRAGTGAMMTRLGEAMVYDVPLSRGRGRREGRPTRHWLRRRMRALLQHIATRAKWDVRSRNVKKTAATLMLMYGFDTHRALWRANGSSPPTGAARLRWISERIGDIVDVRHGDYQARMAKHRRGDIRPLRSTRRENEQPLDSCEVAPRSMTR